MDEERLCIACGVYLTGPFQPKITLTKPPPADAEESEQAKTTVTAHSWICPGCGLVHWYTEDQDLDKLMDIALSDTPLEARPGSSYERRSQMLRMLRRVRRM